MRPPRIELARGWILDRYLGWRDLTLTPTLRLLEQRRGPLRQLLLLTDGAHPDDVDGAVARHHAVSPRAWLTWNDFSPSAGARHPALAAKLTPVRGTHWFGAGTFLVDLSLPEDALFSAIQRARAKEARRAEKKGVRVAILERPAREHVDGFLALHRAMATERGLVQLDEAVLRRMLDEGAAVLVRAVDASGRALVVNVVYLLGVHGYYLHGTRAGDVMDGVGHLAQWETIRWLKGRGALVYDLGLVASEDEGDGIFRFKRSLGGAFVPSGREASREPLLVRIARRLRRGAEVDPLPRGTKRR